MSEEMMTLRQWNGLATENGVGICVESSKSRVEDEWNGPLENDKTRNRHARSHNVDIYGRS